MLQAVINFRRSMPPFRVALRKGKRAFQVPKTALNHHIVSYSFCTPSPQNNIQQEFWLKKRSSTFKLPLDNKYKQWLQNQNMIEVDKTSIIGELIRHGGEAFLLMSMRRSGKSSILRMLKVFFELNYLRTKVTTRRKFSSIQRKQNILVIGRETIEILPKLTYFDNKKISKHMEWEKYKKHQNNHPVIFMDWKGTDTKSFLDAKRFIAIQLHSVYLQYNFLRQNSLFTQYLGILNKIISSPDKQARETSLDGVLVNLIKQLFNFFGKKVLVLIDQYDNPFNNILFAEINEKDPEKKKNLEIERMEVAQLIKSVFLQSLKNVDQLYKGILTGVYDTLIKDGPSGFNNVQIFTMADQGFSSAFGFTKTEIEEQIIKKIFFTEGSEAKNIQRLLEILEKSYNGYLVPCRRQESENGLEQLKKIYNPYSVVLFLFECYLSGKIVQPQSYWNLTGTAKEVLKLFFRSPNFQRLKLRLLSIGLKFETSVAFDPRANLTDLKTSKEKKLEEKIVYLLFHNGFLTGKISASNKLNALIPNLEMKASFDNEFSEWMSFFVDKCEVDYEDLSTFPLLLLKACQKYADFSPETFNEKMVQLLQYGLQCRSKIQHYHVVCQNNVEQGERLNTLFVPKIFKKYLSTKDQQKKAISQNSEGLQEKYIILSEEKITTQKDFNVAYLKALKQLLQKNYLGCLDQNAQNVDNQAGIVLRAVVIVHNSAKNKISVFTSKENAVFSFEQVLKLCLHCKKQEIKAELARKDLSLEDFTKVVRDGSGKTDANFEGKMWHEKQVNLDMKGQKMILQKYDE